MISIPSYSLSGDNYLLNKELSFDFDFDENDFKSNISPNTIFSITTASCKFKIFFI
jgi:hypothetical protein